MRRKVPTVSIQQERKTLADKDSCLVTGVEARLTSDTALQMAINAAFVPISVPQGVFIQVECQVGSTGARFELTAHRAKVSSLTAGDTLDTSHAVSRTETRTTTVAPSVTMKSGQSEVTIDAGSTSVGATDTHEVRFAGHEGQLAVTQVSDSSLSWHLRPHRGEKAVVEYLEGNLTIKASARWAGLADPVMTVTAQPTDLRYFGPKGEVLSLKASVAVWLRMRLKGMPLVSRRQSTHVIRIEEE